MNASDTAYYSRLYRIWSVAAFGAGSRLLAELSERFDSGEELYCAFKDGAKGLPNEAVRAANDVTLSAAEKIMEFCSKKNIELTKMSAADIASAASATDEKLRRDKLVTENLGLVHLCANRFRGRGVEYEELYSSGCVGLVKAAGAFDEERGVKFSTYAVPVILGEIKRVFRDGGTVKVSRSLKELSMKVTREKADFILKNGREPTVCELADIMGESAENIAEALSAALPCISLTGGEDEDGRQQDIPSPFREADIYEGIALRQVMDRLSADDRRLIFLRYFKGLTQSRTADMLGMTQVQVSRREKKILGELRRELV